jgi:hypothetical protein
MQPKARLTAYDRQSERLVAAAALPAGVVTEARRIARVPASDPDLQGVYPLSAAQVAEIAGKAGITLDPERYDYCLEAAAGAAPTAVRSSGVPRTRRERAKANAARARARGEPEG